MQKGSSTAQRGLLHQFISLMVLRFVFVHYRNVQHPPTLIDSQARRSGELRTEGCEAEREAPENITHNECVYFLKIRSIFLTTVSIHSIIHSRNGTHKPRFPTLSVSFCIPWRIGPRDQTIESLINVLAYTLKTNIWLRWIMVWELSQSDLAQTKSLALCCVVRWLSAMWVCTKAVHCVRAQHSDHHYWRLNRVHKTPSSRTKNSKQTHTQVI